MKTAKTTLFTDGTSAGDTDRPGVLIIVSGVVLKKDFHSENDCQAWRSHQSPYGWVCSSVFFDHVVQLMTDCDEEDSFLSRRRVEWNDFHGVHFLVNKSQVATQLSVIEAFIDDFLFDQESSLIWIRTTEWFELIDPKNVIDNKTKENFPIIFVFNAGVLNEKFFWSWLENCFSLRLLRFSMRNEQKKALTNRKN